MPKHIGYMRKAKQDKAKPSVRQVQKAATKAGAKKPKGGSKFYAPSS